MSRASSLSACRPARIVAIGVVVSLAGLAVSGCTPSPQPAAEPAPAAAPAPTVASAGIRRPRFQIAAAQRFDAAAVPAYRGSHPEVYAYIDAHLSEHLEHLRRWVRQPSVSAENRG